jgi:glycosyltransferase involved in cell wall biosynthesis
MLDRSNPDRPAPDDVMPQPHSPYVSVVVPVFNEQENVQPLYQELRQVLDESGLDYEIVFVDDGSHDNTAAYLGDLVAGDPRTTVVQFTRNYGQTAALDAGFKRARGQVLVAMDGDMQNDPRDIPALVRKLEGPPGYDVVSGWRKDRKDKFITRRLPSQLANRLIAKMTWTYIHDFGCTLKAYRRRSLEGVNLYGEMHRFLPAVARWNGARITEMVVNHRPRKAGKSKYGLRRTIKVLLDLMTIKFLGDYLTKPLYFFGKLAMITTACAMLLMAVSVLERFGIGFRGVIRLNNNVLFLFSLILGLGVINFLMMGVISELLVRIYHESQGRPAYRIARVTQGRDTDPAEPRPDDPSPQQQPPRQEPISTARHAPVRSG